MNIDPTPSLLIRMHDKLLSLAIVIAIGLAMAFQSTPALAQKNYPSAEAAADAFADAIARSDQDKLNSVLGKNWRRFVPTSDIDRQDIYDFLSNWAKSHRIRETTAGTSMLEVGAENWTLPIPIVKTNAGWRFDVQAGAEEMRTRRIGRNELDTIQAALAYYDAQKEYASTDRTNDGVLQYAKNFRSTKGKHDGLYWESAGNEPESPLGSLFAGIKQGEGYRGYYYRILDAQGKDAPGGAYNYVIKGRMVSGFALIAWPVRYGDTGIKSFIVSHDGNVYEQDLGPGTTGIARRMTAFNPGPGWEKVTLPEAKTISGEGILIHSGMHEPDECRT